MTESKEGVSLPIKLPPIPGGCLSELRFGSTSSELISSGSDDLVLRWFPLYCIEKLFLYY
jgi:hypothetical protein